MVEKELELKALKVWRAIAEADCLLTFEEIINYWKDNILTSCSRVGIGEREADVLRGQYSQLCSLIPALENLKDSALEFVYPDKVDAT